MTTFVSRYKPVFGFAMMVFALAVYAPAVGIDPTIFAAWIGIYAIPSLFGDKIAR